MRPAVTFCAAATTICLALSVVLFFANNANQALQGELVTKQQDLQTQQQAVELQKQQLQVQEQDINRGNQLAQQVGPAVLRDLGTVAVQNKNEKIKKLLAKYGVTLKEPEATPAPAAATKP
jgi:hypothetical protein